MSPLDFNFTLLKYCGIWRPREWSSEWKTKFYIIYTVCVIFIVFGMTLFEIINILLSLNNIDEFVDNMLMTLTMISSCGKILTMLVYRQRIIWLLETLDFHVCRSNNPEEADAREPYQQLMRNRTMSFTAVCIATMVAMTFSYSTMNIPKRTIPLKIWLPFDVGTGTVYWLIFFEEFLGLFFTAVVNIAYDTLVPAFMISICEQFGLLKVRIEMFVTSIDNNSEYSGKNRIELEKKGFASFIRHHLLLFQFADEANSIFGPEILLQYIASSMVLCMCIYQLGQTKSFNLQLLSIIIYTSSMYLEILLLCLAGTDITEESASFSSVMFNINWFTLSTSSKKSIILMMTRSAMPIIFSSANIIHMSLDSYLKVIKFSYSAYNFLQQSSK